MKNLLFTSTLFLIVNFSFAQTKIQNDLSRDGLKGKVKFYSESYYELVDKFGEIEKGSLSDKYTYKYDVKGNKIEKNYYNAYNGTLWKKYTYKYDEKGNEIEDNHYNGDGSLLSKHTCKYDEKGRMIEENSYNADGSLYSKYTSKYDEKGNKIEYNEYNADGSLESKRTYKYEFDATGNWIKKTCIANDKPKELIERVIEYY